VDNLKNILLADDSSDDVFLIRSAFKKSGFEDPVYVVSNGEQVVQYLKGEGTYADRKRFPVPHLLLLDLNMPRMNGFDVLSWIRGRSEWMCLPIIVLTTSFYGPEIKRAYDLGANSFITKPPEFLQLLASLKEVGEHWLRRALLPEPGPFVPSPAHAAPLFPRPRAEAGRAKSPRAHRKTKPRSGATGPLKNDR
jgi:CheY-like chemotaxis protein